MLKQIYEEARSKVVAEKEVVIAQKVAEVTASVVNPKIGELEAAKTAAIAERTESYNASLVGLKAEYDRQVAALRESYEQAITDIKVASETAKTTFRDTQIAAATATVEAHYATEIRKLDELISAVGE